MSSYIIKLHVFAVLAISCACASSDPRAAVNAGAHPPRAAKRSTNAAAEQAALIDQLVGHDAVLGVSLSIADFFGNPLVAFGEARPFELLSLRQANGAEVFPDPPTDVLPAGTAVRVTQVVSPAAVAAGLKGALANLQLERAPTRHFWLVLEVTDPKLASRPLVMVLGLEVTTTTAAVTEAEQLLRPPAWAKEWLYQRKTEILTGIMAKRAVAPMTLVDLRIALGEPRNLATIQRATTTPVVADYGTLHVTLKDGVVTDTETVIPLAMATGKTARSPQPAAATNPPATPAASPATPEKATLPQPKEAPSAAHRVERAKREAARAKKDLEQQRLTKLKALRTQKAEGLAKLEAFEVGVATAADNLKDTRRHLDVLGAQVQKQKANIQRLQARIAKQAKRPRDPKSLGLSLEAVNPQVAVAIGLSAPGGAYASKVAPDSEAESSGLRAHDVVLRLGNAKVEGVAQLSQLMKDSPPNKPMIFLVLRKHKEMELTVGTRDAERMQRTETTLRDAIRDAERTQSELQKTRAEEQDRNQKWLAAKQARNDQNRLVLTVTQEELRIVLRQAKRLLVRAETQRRGQDAALKAARNRVAELNAVVARPRQLGITIQTVTGQLAHVMGLDRPVGAFVATVNQNGEGAKGGLRQGDLILRVGNDGIVTASDFLRQLADVSHTQTLVIQVLRSGQKKMVRVPAVEDWAKARSALDRAEKELAQQSKLAENARDRVESEKKKVSDLENKLQNLALAKRSATADRSAPQKKRKKAYSRNGRSRAMPR